MVLETAELLADMLDRTGFPNAEAAARAPRMMAGVIELAIGRVTLLRKVVLHQVDVALLVGRRNKRNRIAPGEDQDVLLPVKARR